MGREIQQHKTCRVCPQLQVLPIWVRRRLLYSTLPVSKADDMHVGKIADAGKTPLLQHEMIIMMIFDHLSEIWENEHGGERKKEKKGKKKFCSHRILILYILWSLTDWSISVSVYKLPFNFIHCFSFLPLCTFFIRLLFYVSFPCFF